MSSNVERIKEKLDIVEVVGSYLKLVKTGKNLKARCPFHNEKTPSFFVSPERDSFYCFGCGRGGDIFTFVEDFEGLDFLGAMKILADKAGIEIELGGKGVSKKEKDRMYEILDKTTSFFEANLRKEKEALKYLKARGIEKEILSNFRVGFAPKGWRNLYNYLKQEGYSDKEMKEVGVIKESKGKVYDLFRERIIFPIFDSAGRVVAFSGRVFGENDSDAKYINSPETKLFNKSKILYGFDRAKGNIRKNDFAILVEGMTDVLMAHKIGYGNTVAVSGTSLTEKHLNLLKRMTKRIVFAFDSDSAGFRASSRAAKTALSMGIDLKVAALPEGKDPADIILEDEKLWRESIKSSEHIIEYLLQVFKEETRDKRSLGIKVREEILPYVVMVENKIDQSHFIKMLAEELEIKEDVLFEEMGKIDMEDKRESLIHDDGEKEAPSRKKEIEKRILGIILWKKNHNKEKIKNFLKEVKKTRGYDLMEKYEDEEKNNFETMARIFFEGSDDIEREIDELILNYKEDYLKGKMEEQMSKIKKAEEEKNDKKLENLLKDYQETSNKLEKIKKSRS